MSDQKRAAHDSHTMKRSLNVLVLAQYFPPDMGGSSTRASNVVKGLLGEGSQVTVVAAFPHYPLGEVPIEYRRRAIIVENAGNAKVFRVWIPALPHNSIVKRILLHFCFVFSSLFALPFVGDYDVVWAANPNLFCFLPAVVYGCVKSKRIIRNVDDLWPEVFYELGIVRSRMMHALLDFIAWLSYVVPAAVTPISVGYKNKIVEKYKIDARKIYVIEVGIETIQPLKVQKKEHNQFVVMYSGNLGQGYDFDIILESAKYLADEKEIVFVIRGIGELAPTLRFKICELGLKNVVLNTEFLPKEELYSLLSSADVFALPMIPAHVVDEGLPTKVFEYQAYGKPIICVSSGEAARYVEATRSGLIVKPKDAHGFVEAVKRLYMDSRFGEELGKKGRDYVSEHLTAGKIGQRMCTVLTSVAFSE